MGSDAARKERVPVRAYLMKQGHFAHIVEEDIEYIQPMVDQMWEEWEAPGVTPLRGTLKLAAKK
jgi:pyruvate ferredoxin oxidoreductase beta subunit